MIVSAHAVAHHQRLHVAAAQTGETCGAAHAASALVEHALQVGAVGVAALLRGELGKLVIVDEAFAPRDRESP